MKRKFASIREAHETLGTGRPTLYRMIDNGVLETVKMGSTRLVCINSLEHNAKEGWKSA